MRRHVSLAFILAAVGALACHAKQPPVVTPTPRPGANQDSINAVRERARQDSVARARRDSIARAQQMADDAARRAAADADAMRARVDAARKTILQTVYFDFDKADLTSEVRALLDAKVTVLRANPAVRIRVSGHADARGSDEYNLALSQRRAESVKRYLSQAGIAESRIDTRGYGEERPAITGETEEAYAANRRAEFEITAGGETITVPR
jgi:peptidoglycan-associated lipoprotein